MAIQKHTRRDFIKQLGLGTVAMALPQTLEIIQGATPKKGKAKPNIILILTDDQGWTDTSVQMMADRPDSKSDFYQTPNLERLAREGMRFSSGYISAPQCSPTRVSIQFGKTPARLKQTHNHDLIGSDCRDEISTAQMIKAWNPNYGTAHFGKWMLRPPRVPEDMGYDESDGDTGNGDGSTDTVDGKKVPLPDDDPKRIFSTTRKANDFMEKKVKMGQPFFMQISHYALHVKHMCLKKTYEKYEKILAQEHLNDSAWITYASMIEDLDTGLGLLLDKVDELGIADNTYIIYTSDNGGAFRGNEPLKGCKRTLWEGGIRVPMVMRGPGIKPGSFCDVPVVGWDFLPTISDLIGNKKPLPDGIDGGSLRPLFEKGSDGKVKRGTEPLIFHFIAPGSTPVSAIRLDDYKLIKNLDTNEMRLFNLSEDIEERKDISSSMPQKAKELHKKLMNYLETVDANTIEEARKARRQELQKSNEKTKKEINELKERIKEVTNKKEKERFEQKLVERREQLQSQKDRLEEIGKIEHKAWGW